MSHQNRDSLSYQVCTFRKCNFFRIVPILLILLICNGKVHAAGSVEVAGDILKYVLPGAAGALALGHKDHWGALQFVGSAATTLGVTYDDYSPKRYLCLYL